MNEEENQDGLCWAEAFLGSEPRWSREPDVRTIERVV